MKKNRFCRLLLAFCLALIFNPALSQNQKLDSLELVLKNAKGTERVDALNGLVNEIVYTDLARATELTNEAGKISNVLNYIKGKIQTDISRILILKEKQDYATALTLAAKTMVSARNEKLDSDQSMLYRIMVSAYRDWNKYTRSSDLADEYLDFATKQNNNGYLGHAHKQKATTCYYRGDLECALEHFEKSMSYYEKAGDFQSASGMGMNLGVILYRSGKAKESLNYFDRAIAAFEKNHDTANIANALLNKGLSYEMLGESKEAHKIFLKVADMYRQIKNEQGYAGIMEIIGNSYTTAGDYANSLKYLLIALRSREKSKDKRGIAMSYSNIGSMYAASRDTNKAIEYVLKAKNINKEIGNEYNYANNLMVLGGYYLTKKRYNETALFLYESISVRKRLGDIPGLAGSYINLGNMHLVLNQTDSAQNYYLLALKINESGENARSLAGVYSNLGKLYLGKKDYRSALVYLSKAKNGQEKIGDFFNLSVTYQAMSEVYAAMGDYKNAYTYYNLFHRATDSMFNQNMSQSIAEMQAKYGVEKKQKENEILRQKSKLDKAEIQRKEEARKKQQVIIYAVIGVALLCVLLLVVVSRTSSHRKKINAQLALQNEIIEEKNKDITDSISYAKRIQEAILPPAHVVKELLNESFVLYQPKDIVSGDFYFVEQSANKVLFAAVDCTGHGVPGAFMSIVGHNALSKAVKEYHLTEPGQLLDKLNMLVEETLDAHGTGIKDGMDISLCVMDQQLMKLSWAGANNPLWIIDSENNFIEFKPDKQPIGNFENRKPFTGHEYSLKKGDMVYVFTDGYADQFGGPGGKKFKYSQLKEVLLSIKHLPMEEQKAILIQKIESWRGALEQIDDICIIGVRV